MLFVKLVDTGEQPFVAAENAAGLPMCERDDDDFPMTQDSASSFTSSGMSYNDVLPMTDDDEVQPGREVVLDTVVTSSDDRANGMTITCLTPFTQTSIAFVVTQLDCELATTGNTCTCEQLSLCSVLTPSRSLSKQNRKGLQQKKPTTP